MFRKIEASFKWPRVLPVFSISLALSGCLSVSGCLLMGDRFNSISYMVSEVSSDGWPQPLKRSLEFFKADKCQEASTILWPLAKQGNTDARYLLAEARSFGLILPRLTEGAKSNDQDLRHYLTLYTYASLAPSNFRLRSERFYSGLRKTIPRILGAMTIGETGRPVAACYESGAPYEDCHSLALSLGVVQSFQAYANDIDRNSRKHNSDWFCDYSGTDFFGQYIRDKDGRTRQIHDTARDE